MFYVNQSTGKFLSPDIVRPTRVATKRACACERQCPSSTTTKPFTTTSSAQETTTVASISSTSSTTSTTPSSRRKRQLNNNNFIRLPPFLEHCNNGAYLKCDDDETIKIHRALFGLKSDELCPSMANVFSIPTSNACDETITTTKIIRER